MILLSLLFFFSAEAFEIISHKGVHHEECLDPSYRCQAHCLKWKSHFFIENTIPGMTEAFRLGADRIEMDLNLSKDNQVVVFHDYDLSCRTGLNKRTTDLSVKQLKQLDIAKKIRFINRKDNPLKGRGIALIPTLQEVLDAFPQKRFLLNPKTEDPRLARRIFEILHEYTQVKRTHQISDFTYWGPTKLWNKFKSRFPDFGDRFSHSYTGSMCEQSLMAYSFIGVFPPACIGFNMALHPLMAQDFRIWGGWYGVKELFHIHQHKVYAIHIKDNEELRRLRTFGIDGVITSIVEQIMPQ